MKIFQAVLIPVFISVVILTIFSPSVANAGGAVDSIDSAVGGFVDVISNTFGSAINVISNTVLGTVETWVGDLTGTSFLSDDGRCRLENKGSSPLNAYSGRCGVVSGGAGPGSEYLAVIPTEGVDCSFTFTPSFYIPNFNTGFQAIGNGVVDKTTIDETQNRVALYRFVASSAITDRERSNWFLSTISNSVGDGILAIENASPNYGIDPYIHTSQTQCGPGSTPSIGDSEGNCIPVPGTPESEPFVTFSYSSGCTNDICNRFKDLSLPPNSYVVYAAKILGNPGSGDYMMLDGSTSPAKFLNTNGTAQTFFQTTAIRNDGSAVFSPGNAMTKIFKTPDCPAVPAPAVNLNVDLAGKSEITLPNKIPLSWTTTDASSCTASGDWSGTKSVNGSESVSKSEGFYTFVLTCSNAKGSASASANVTVVKPPAPVFDFRAPDTVQFPSPIGLSWLAENVDSCTASGDWSGSKSFAPNVYQLEQISKPRGNYSFTLGCSGPGGDVSNTKNVSVIEVPSCSFSASPDSVIPPQPSTLTWSCSGANACSIDNGIGGKSASGSVRVNPSNTTTYNLTCSGPDGNRSFSSTVNVGFIQKIREIIPR